MRLLGVAALLVLLAACGNGGDPKGEDQPETLDVSGQLDLAATGNGVLADNRRKGAGCVGQNGYEDIQTGAQVVIRDEAGKTVGIGKLDAGTMATGLYATNAHCTFNFTISDIDSTADFLSVEVAKRGQIQFDRDQAQALVLTLG